MKVIANRATCTGHGLCAVKCAEIFKLDDNGYIDIGDDPVEVPSALYLKAAAGIDACPEGALREAQ